LISFVGCGCVVFLVGPSAPLVVERGTRSSHMENSYDFYKPHLHSPYPVVDGKFSNSCYLRALDKCYQNYCKKYNYQFNSDYNIDSTSYLAFHGPYNKLVQKAYARALYNDSKNHPNKPQYAPIQANFAQIPTEQSYDDVNLEKALVGISKASYGEKVLPSTLLPVHVGNMYTASLYASILSLVSNKATELPNQHILCFSYGSGLAASIFALRVASNAAPALQRIAQTANLAARLAQRSEKNCAEFNETMKIREKLHQLGEFKAEGALELWPGTYYLVAKDSTGKREYKIFQGNNEKAEDEHKTN
jgi:hydroxymethylglutaryl-CoA synthase